MKKYFVWIKGTRGPCAQIWYGTQYTGEGQKRDENVLSIKEIEKPFYDLTLDQLLTVFPYKEGR